MQKIKEESSQAQSHKTKVERNPVILISNLFF